MITIKIELDGDEFHTWSSELPGCHTHGKTINEAMENLKDAVQLYLEVLINQPFLNGLYPKGHSEL